MNTVLAYRRRAESAEASVASLEKRLSVCQEKSSRWESAAISRGKLFQKLRQVTKHVDGKCSPVGAAPNLDCAACLLEIWHDQGSE